MEEVDGSTGILSVESSTYSASSFFILSIILCISESILLLPTGGLVVMEEGEDVDCCVRSMIESFITGDGGTMTSVFRKVFDAVVELEGDWLLFFNGNKEGDNVDEAS